MYKDVDKPAGRGAAASGTQTPLLPLLLFLFGGGRKSDFGTTAGSGKLSHLYVCIFVLNVGIGATGWRLSALGQPAAK